MTLTLTYVKDSLLTNFQKVITVQRVIPYRLLRKWIFYKSTEFIHLHMVQKHRACCSIAPLTRQNLVQFNTNPICERKQQPFHSHVQLVLSWVRFLRTSEQCVQCLLKKTGKQTRLSHRLRLCSWLHMYMYLCISKMQCTYIVVVVTYFY